MSADLAELEAAIGYHFENREPLVRALTHKSLVYERTPSPEEAAASDNEQLEFLGDAVLGFVTSECLVRRHPGFPEGRLSKLKAHLVSAAHLYEVAQALNLGRFLLLGRGEEMSGGREKRALLANALEAMIAALYVDGGLDAARRFIEGRVLCEPGPEEPNADLAVNDYKSALQETAVSLKLPQPRYVIVDEQGPEHAKTFTVEVRVGRQFVGRAQGLSKKSAGQQAARQVLEQITTIPAETSEDDLASAG